MEVENTLAKKIDAAGQNASYDRYCRKLLVNRQILARILKACVKEFQDCPIKDIEEKYIEGTPKVHEVAVHRDESAEFIDGIGKEDVAMTKTMEREAMEMCNLSQGIVDRTLINAIISMMTNLKLSEEECMEALNIPQEHRELYHMMLQDKMKVSQV